MHVLRLSILCSLLAPAVFGMGRPPETFTVLLVPAKHHLVQLGRDMMDREKVLLMTYAPNTAPDNLFLHAWDNGGWVRVRQEAFSNGAFLRNPSVRMLVVGAPNDLTASLIERVVAWSPEVLHLESENVTELINGLGRIFQFTQQDWEWFAERYELQLEDLNRDQRGQSWYDTHRASDLPPATKPWRKEKEAAAAPRTSLEPILPAEEMESPTPGDE